ncbi:glycogen synthase GlgA [Lachnospiraceae bacterium ZAX-1]
MKKILFVASEAAPFVKTGGLGEVVGALPKYINSKKYDVRVILPKYQSMDKKWDKKLKKITDFTINVSWRQQYVGLMKTKVGNIQYYFIDSEYYFGGSAPYDNIYMDFEKFTYFCKAVVESLQWMDFIPDIIHCHDWQSSLIPMFLYDMLLSENHAIKSIQTIHNMRFQGRLEMGLAKDIIGLDAWYFLPDKLEFYGEVNCLKGGIIFADKITTVSHNYAKEIQTPEGGEGLNGLMRVKADSLIGIENGIDYMEYNPSADDYIPTNYDVDTVKAGKRENKKRLQKEMGLAVNSKAFLIGVVSRLTKQKGFDLLKLAMKDLCTLPNIQFVILGSGEEGYESMLRYYTQQYPDKIAASIGYSDELSHKIYAAADAYLMPSMFEPCGLSQLISMRYGTLPIVRETGGLKDTVKPYNQYEQTGDGFGFQNYNWMEMYQIILYAKEVFEVHKKQWNAMVQRAMQEDHSWESSAKKYEELYEEVLG